MNTITHNNVTIKTLESYQTPAVQCAPGDIYIKPNEDGFWLYSWDGQESWGLVDDAFDTLDEAVEAAKELAENVGDND